MGFDRKDYNPAALRAGYRSGLEKKIDEQFIARKLDSHYEETAIPYVSPAKKRTYTPDFKLPCGDYVETKGRMMTADRQKMLLVKEQQPNIRIRLVFSNANARINKGSNTRYSDWANKNGFIWADKLIPESWFGEPIPTA